jgi:hypothetical protein
MLFSDSFYVSPELIKEYGAVDISLICDLPLFIDPLLIFNSDKPAYKKLHEEIIKYFHFLATKAQDKLTAQEIKTWFSFNEVRQNWLGFSLVGNEGLALGKEFSDFLAKNIKFALNNNGISKDRHIEKVMLLYEGSGKDKISDLTVNLIKEFLLEYTQRFATENISPDLLKVFPVDKAFFNYKTESFVSKEYTLPCIVDKTGKCDYVLLTPFDILREAEPSINRGDFFRSHERIRAAIENDVLKVQVENYIVSAIAKYEERQKLKKRKVSERTINRIQLMAFKEAAKVYPELYDYYIKLREDDTDEIRIECLDEVDRQFAKIIINSIGIIDTFHSNNYSGFEEPNAREEGKKRLRFFKHIIEDCDAYKNFYVEGKCIALENDLQRMFKLVWYGTSYKADFETNNGRGPADVVISKGQNDQCIVEFKLASNSRLPHVFEQVRIYETANNTDGSLIAIFCFSEKDYKKTLSLVKDLEYEDRLDESIFIIDCRADNKPSASRA